MKTKRYLNILYNEHKYEVELDKLIYILSCLESRNVSFSDEENIKTLLKNYGLMDEVFLENINKIW